MSIKDVILQLCLYSQGYDIKCNWEVELNWPAMDIAQLLGV